MTETLTIQQGRVSISEIIRTVARELGGAGLIAKGKLPREDKRYGVEVMMDKTDHSKILLRFVTHDDCLIEWSLDCKKIASDDGRKYLQEKVYGTLNDLMIHRQTRAQKDTNIVYPQATGVANGVRRTLH